MIPAVAIAVLIGGVIGYLVALQRSGPTPRPDGDVVASVDRIEASSRPDDPQPAGLSGLATDPVMNGEESDASVDDVGFVLRLAANELELGVTVCAADGRVIYRNRAASAMTGTHAGVIVEEHVDHALSTARRGTSLDEVVELHGPPRVALRLRAEPMPNGLAVATIEDVSERSRLDAMRTDFVANISHELKTPVGAIAVLAEALLDETDPAVVERVSTRLVDEAHRAVKAIDDLLELSRIEGNSGTTDVVDLDDVVQEAIARGRVVDAGQGVAVTAFDAHPSISLRADRRQLVSALGNLVENAVKYSGDEGVVQVRTRATDRVIEVMVADQGDGIPARDLNRIFERFYRVDRARSRRTGGTGLGLSIVRHVAANHGGEVLVSSTEGEGSTFVLRLPIALMVDGIDDDHDHDHDERQDAMRYDREHRA